MAAQVNHDDDEVMSAINIIPFVDIVLVLLIIFMVTSTAIVKAAIKVELPKAAAAGSAVSATVNVVYTKERQIIIDGNEMKVADAEKLLKSMAAAKPDLQAVISADTLLPYGEVVKIVDMIKLSGVNTFALNIERTVK